MKRVIMFLLALSIMFSACSLLTSVNAYADDMLASACDVDDHVHICTDDEHEHVHVVLEAETA